MANRAGRTAFGPLVQVAIEQFQPEGKRILRDDLAYRFLPPAGRLLAQVGRVACLREALFTRIESRAPGVRGGILCRKRYIDEKLAEGLASGIVQVVNLGAGMDTRLYRLPQPGGLRTFEVDMQENIAFKRKSLERMFGNVPGHVTLVPIDFNRQELGEILDAAGYQAGQPGFFLWEGVTQYLLEDAVRRTFACLGRMAAGSRLVFTYILQDFIAGPPPPPLQAFHRATSGLWQFGLDPGRVATLLAEYGWQELEQAGHEEYRERYLRP